MDDHLHLERDYLLPRAIHAKPLILVNPHASDLCAERRWDAAKFSALIGELTQAYPEIAIVLIGAPAEIPYTIQVIQGVAEEFQSHIVNLAGLSLDELCTLISRAELLITNDSGPMHIAFSLSRPVLSLFGPSSPDHYAWHPTMQSLNNPVYKRLYCSPCLHLFDTAPCHGDNECMKHIQVKEVLELAHQILSRSPVDHHSLCRQEFCYQRAQKVYGVRQRGQE
jgi:heptosyltransferase-2